MHVVLIHLYDVFLVRGCNRAQETTVPRMLEVFDFATLIGRHAFQFPRRAAALEEYSTTGHNTLFEICLSMESLKYCLLRQYLDR